VSFNILVVSVSSWHAINGAYLRKYFRVLLEICMNSGYGPGSKIVAIRAQFSSHLPVCRACLVRLASRKPISRINHNLCTRDAGNTAPESGLPRVASISHVIYALVVTQTIVDSQYCGYESLVDVRRALNVIREAGRIRNDLTVGPIFAA